MHNYDLLLNLGRGHYGTVYKASSQHDGTLVALKRIRLDTYRPISPEIISNIEKEVEKLKALKNENLVDIVDVLLTVNQDITFIYEWIPINLWTYLYKHLGTNQMSRPLIKSYVYQVRNALKFCDNLNFHGNVKPNNLLISPEGVIKLSDYGLRALVNEVNKPPLKSTIFYSAPEVLLDIVKPEYSNATDIWSLGCIFAEMVMKNILFRGVTEYMQLVQIFGVMTTPTEETWPGVTKLDNFDEFPKYRTNRLGNILPSLGLHGLDLLQGMMRYNPETRLTAIEMETHPYFYDLDLGAKPTFTDS